MHKQGTGIVAECSDIIGECNAKLIPAYGVIHLQNALNDEGQQRIWNMFKSRIKDPSSKATTFHCFDIAAKDHKGRKPVNRVALADYYAKLLFTLSADAIVKLNVDTSNEPSYQRLENLANSSKPFQPGQMFGNYYRSDGTLLNHTDGDGILFTMTFAVGDDCEFHIGKATNRSKRLSERSGKVEKLIMKSGDAVFFDGGSTPHQVVRIIKDTGPSWWNDVKVENGSRLVVVFREQEGCFYSNKIKREQKKKKQQQGAASSEKKRSETKRK